MVWGSAPASCPEAKGTQMVLDMIILTSSTGDIYSFRKNGKSLFAVYADKKMAIKIWKDLLKVLKKSSIPFTVTDEYELHCEKDFFLVHTPFAPSSVHCWNIKD